MKGECTFVPKTGKAPDGYYSASQVMKKLGIASSTLYHFVNTGKIRKVIPPNMREGYYVKKDVDNLFKEKEQFDYLQSEGAYMLKHTREKEQDTMKEVFEKLEVIEKRLNQLETKVNENTILLNQILARLE
jgi:predicted transcriptional regulator